MTVRHNAEPSTDHPIELSLDYALSDPDVLIGISPDQRYEEMRRQLLAGPLQNISTSGVPENAISDANVNANIDGDHNYDPEAGSVSGTIKLTGIIAGHDRMTPDQMLAAARPHFANALAKDIDAGLGENLKQHAAQEG